MALRKRTGARTTGNIWAGFVDSMSALLLIMIFVLSVFMIAQFYLRDVIAGQGAQLSSLESQLGALSEALGATKRERDELKGALDQSQEDIAKLQFTYEDQTAAIANYEEQLAALIAANSDLEKKTLVLETDLEKFSESEATLEEALLIAREKMTEEEYAAKKELLRQEALGAMLQALENTPEAAASTDPEAIRALALAKMVQEGLDPSHLDLELQKDAEALTEAEITRLADQAASEFLRKQMQNATDEITALTLELEEARKDAEETLTLLAGLETKRAEIKDAALSEDEKNAALLKIAQEEIALRATLNEKDAKRLALLNRQVAELRGQLGALQEILDESAKKDAEQNVQIEALGKSLNSALARVAATERARADDLETYRSEFFGELRKLLENVEGVRIEGDRFLFSTEVLFPLGSATLSKEGKVQISKVSKTLMRVSENIPSNIPWILRVDGHTDTVPVSESNPYNNNWELSQARALAVVTYMIEVEGFDPKHLAAAGFGEFQPINEADTPESMAQNRRIEMKLTEK